MPHFLQIWVADVSAYNLELSIFGAAICPKNAYELLVFGDLFVNCWLRSWCCEGLGVRIGDL